MGKFTTYMAVMLGLILLFHFTGLTTQCDDDGLCTTKSPTSKLLDLLLNVQKLQDSNLNLKILLTIGGILAGGIIAIASIAGKTELAVMTITALWLVPLMFDFLAVVGVVWSANPVIAILIFSPLMFIWLLTSLEWWRGISN